MTLIDANILLYAYDSKAQHHTAARKWLEALLDSAEQIALPWITLWAFLRISTNPRILTRPLEAPEAFSIVHSWIRQPGVTLLNPGERHAELLQGLLIETGARGALVTDAALAALAIEYGATLASTDHGFRRFRNLRWINPVQG